MYTWNTNANSLRRGNTFNFEGDNKTYKVDFTGRAQNGTVIIVTMTDVFRVAPGETVTIHEND